MNLLVPNLKRRKTSIPNFDWKSIPTLVGITTVYMLDVGGWSGMGAFTLVLDRNENCTYPSMR